MSEHFSLPTTDADYWQLSKRPLTSLLFVLPLLVIYEGGVLVLGPHALRNGVDVWLRTLLDWIGFGQYFLLPVLTVASLLAWHHIRHDRWQVRPRVLGGMAIESAVLSLVLIGLAHLQGHLLHVLAKTAHLASIMDILPSSVTDFLGRLVGFFGAGIYEEVLFRLLLLPLVAAAIRSGGGTAMQQAVGSIVITSLCFSLAHYVGPHGEPWQWYSFFFRFGAGAFFAILFVIRGFGIVAGTHALYDIFVGLF